MYKPTSLLVLAAVASARKCHNITVPITISSRNGVFDIDLPSTEVETTDFFLNFGEQGQNYTETILTDYATINGSYELATTYCEPDAGPGSTLQVLTHGVGFDRSYWDFPYNNYNYSYVVEAVDQHNYSTLSWDRLGIGMSSKGDALAEIQIFLEVAALQNLTSQLRQGTICNIDTAYDKVVHVGHSFGSGITLALANMYSNISDGIILTGFSQVGQYMAEFALGGNFVPVAEIAALANNYPAGYYGAGDASAVHTNFFGPGDFDPAVLQLAYSTGQPVSAGEILTLGAGAGSSSPFTGPVLIITGERDVPFCGGNCLGTSAINYTAPSLPASSATYFTSASPFNATVVPGAGHGLNFGYSHTFTYSTILEFLGANA